jgi:hypothetical protein
VTSWAGSEGGSGAGAAFFPGAFGVAGFGGASAGAAAAVAAFSFSPYSFLKRISTGSSIVEEGDLTNSPISLSFSRTNLLSTPNSLASSWTRVLATVLLLARVPGSRCGRGQIGPLVVVQTHRKVLIECS